MCLHTSVCSCVCTGLSVPKDIPIILSTLPSWWHQMVLTKENLVHPLSSISCVSLTHTHTCTHTYAHTKENKKHCFTMNRFVCASAVCHFWCVYLQFCVHLGHELASPHQDDMELTKNQCFLSNKLTDNLQWKGALGHWGSQIRSDRDLVHVPPAACRELPKLTLSEKRIFVSAGLLSFMSSQKNSWLCDTHSRWERCNVPR